MTCAGERISEHVAVGGNDRDIDARERNGITRTCDSVHPAVANIRIGFEARVGRSVGSLD